MEPYSFVILWGVGGLVPLSPAPLDRCTTDNKRCHWQMKDIVIGIKIHCSHKKTTEVTVDLFTLGINFFYHWVQLLLHVGATFFYKLCMAVIIWASTLYRLVWPADNLCKQFGPRSGLTKCQVWSGSICLTYFKNFLKKLILKRISR